VEGSWGSEGWFFWIIKEKRRSLVGDLSTSLEMTLFVNLLSMSVRKIVNRTKFELKQIISVNLMPLEVHLQYKVFKTYISEIRVLSPRPVFSR
jgi:hypothetical protein